MASKLVAVNESGRRIGEDHPKARLTNFQVDRVFELRERGWSYTKIANKFKVSRECIRSICLCRTRGQWASRFKKVDHEQA